MPPSWSCEDMFEEFRAMGGTADNVVRREGPFGLGLFPIDAARPVTLHIPASMLVPCHHVRQEGDDLVVSPESHIDPRVRDFFTRYQRAFSWGTEARLEVETFHRLIAGLPDDITRALAKIGVEIKRPLGERWSPLELFKRTRVITYRDEQVFMPIIELLNHGKQAQGFDMRDGIRVAGSFSGEVLVHYGPADSLGRFFSQQFVSEELTAFSLTITIPLGYGEKSLYIGRRITEMQATNPVPLLPVVREEGNEITLSHVMLGHERFPRLPRTLFRQVLPDLAPEQADELFQRIVNTNIQLLLGLLDALDENHGEIARQLRRVARLQLKTITHSYGARDISTISVQRDSPG